MKSVDVKLEDSQVGEDTTKLIADMDIKAKYGILGKIMERLIIKLQLGGAVGNLFVGVEDCDKTGIEISVLLPLSSKQEYK